MTRTHRLFQLMTTLRRLPAPVRATQLAEELGTSLRTVYRDIDALRGLGAVIDGEAGFGYTLIEDAALPPLGFENDELEALVLGLRDVAVIGDPALAKAAKSALAKITSRVPPRQAHRLQHAVLDARRFVSPTPPKVDVADLRAATWDEETVRFSYVDGKGEPTQREVDPLGIIYMQDTNMLMAWCHLRRDFRVFRLDRMDDLARTGASFRPRRVPMLREYTEKLRAEAQARAEGRAQ
ncbi:helix-turn-helix transcriptional regulator [Sulfitobacter noctilucicola]|uniref:Putative DNA-binding transcriptional regulator YafY n=1 Tax=Sulfitobacter noctilucicola TaxID=1342301 RepID=A0A7W6M6N8_9RHOB|nr:YafY family protein [Sulfitobacter noctilucicola]MBB4172476.1 putative DNA-binding transcriptional regulator YafY [Sulfitobacter noctilucicola]